MTSNRKTALVAGVLFLITELTAIAGLLLYGPALGDANYVTGAGADGRILLGALSELLLVLAMAGTAVTLYPIIRRQNEGIALAHVALRLLEGAVITVGIVSTLALVTLRQDGPARGTNEAGLVAVGQALVAIHDWTFLYGPSFFLGVNSLLLAYLVYRAQLVPSTIAWLGMVGGPLVAISGVGVLFGVYGSETHIASALPVFAWEVSFAIYLIVKGFKPSPVTTDPTFETLRPAVTAS